jgi:hypothetical protein
MLPNRGAFPGFTRTFVNARLAEVRRSLLLCPGCVERFEVDVCSVNRYPCAEDACYRTSVSSLVQGVGTTSSAPQAAACLSRLEIRSTKGARLAGSANLQAAMPVRLFPRCARRALAVSAAIGRFDRTPPPHRCSRTGHCSCPRCSGRRRPSRVTDRAETQSILRSRRTSRAPCPCTLLRFARMRRCARPRHRLRCGAACRRCRCCGGFGCTDRVPPRRPRSSPPRRSGRCLPACRCTRPVACARARSTGLRPGYGCSPAMPNRLRMPSTLAALRRPGPA